MTFDKCGSHQMIQALTSLTRESTDPEQVDLATFPPFNWTDDGGLPTKQHVWEYENLQTERRSKTLGERECLAYKYRIRLLQMFVFAATTRTASLMLTTLPTTTRTGTGEGARLPPVGVPVPIWTPTTRTPHSPRLSSLGTIIPSVSDFCIPYQFDLPASFYLQSTQPNLT